MYDYLVVGAGLYGAVFAQQARERGKKVLVIDKRSHIAGNIYTEEIEDIQVHRYGAHIFHTSSKQVWDYACRFAEFKQYIHSPVASYQGQLYSLPFNMYTFCKMWKVTSPAKARERIERQRQASAIETPANLEEQAMSLVGREIYEKLIQGYTQKQWGRPCQELPAFLIQRLPLRFTFDGSYFDALYQGIPKGGYTSWVEHMLDGIEVGLGEDYLKQKGRYDSMADKVIYTGPIDAYFDYRLGPLEYRSLQFEWQILNQPNFQSAAVVNYTDAQVPWTRIVEHKWFDYQDQPKTIISKEYSIEWERGMEPYYPINDEKNTHLYQQYADLAQSQSKVIFGGRLGEYKYMDMDQIIAAALSCARKQLQEN